MIPAVCVGKVALDVMTGTATLDTGGLDTGAVDKGALER